MTNPDTGPESCNQKGDIGEAIRRAIREASRTFHSVLAPLPTVFHPPSEPAANAPVEPSVELSISAISDAISDAISAGGGGVDARAPLGGAVAGAPLGGGGGGGGMRFG